MKIFTRRKTFFYLNILIIFCAFLISVWLKPATVRVYIPNYWRPLFGFSVIWLGMGILSGKYNYDLNDRLLNNWLKIYRSDMYSLTLIMFLLFFFNVFHYSRLVVFGTVIFSFTIESLIFIGWYYTRRYSSNSDISTYLNASPTEYVESDHAEERQFIELPETDLESVQHKLENIWLKDDLSLLQFIKENTQLKKIPAKKSQVIYTHHLYNLKFTEPSSQLLFVNLIELNGWSQINKYLKQVNKNLEIGGYFVSCGEDYRDLYKKYFKKYPMFIAIIVSIGSFLFRRIFQKIPGIREICYAIFHDSRKPFSMCELLGRVAYSGFDIIDYIEKDNRFYFIAQKNTTIPDRKDPVYGPLFSMKRVGYQGNDIYLYKVRTMFPYAQYLQEFLYHKFKLQSGGKFKSDFRIIPWGNFLRSTWIDELPQFLNLLKGEIKLVGVRSISKHYFSLYPKEAQELRIQVKPGIIPPFYVDMPETFEEIVESEMRYIKAYKKHPFITDLKYFFLVFYNIVFRHARSA